MTPNRKLLIEKLSNEYLQKVYTLDEIKSEPFENAIKKLQSYWEWRCMIQYNNDGKEMGSCTIGAGFYVWLLMPRKRNPEKYVIAYPKYQGSCTFEPSVPDVRKYAENLGLDVDYNYGRLD